MRRLGGKEVGDAILASLAPKIEELGKKGVVPTLGVLRVGAREDDLAYERGLKKKFESAGCGVRVLELPADVSQEDLDKGFDSLRMIVILEIFECSDLFFQRKAVIVSNLCYVNLHIQFSLRFLACVSARFTGNSSRFGEAVSLPLCEMI